MPITLSESELNALGVPYNTRIYPEICSEGIFKTIPFKLTNPVRKDGGSRLPKARELSETAVPFMVHLMFL